MRKPREGEIIEEEAQNQNDQNGGGVIEIPLGADIELVVDVNIAEEEIVPQEMVEAQPVNPDGAQAEPNEAQPNANAEAGQQQPNGVPAPQGDDEWGLAGRAIYPIDIASTIMGALFFPAISSLMGDLLKYTLPRRWVTKPFLSISPRIMKTLPATGLLQEKWGRSIVGGCLFVVLKDALILYVKWKRARDHGKRRILDYVAK
jgi:hypothetical protein